MANQKYTVKIGDTWDSIARQYGLYDTTSNLPDSRLVSMNGGHAFNLHHGMQITVPLQAKAASVTDPLTGLTSDQKNAYQSLIGILKTWNLDTLAPDILKYIQQGYQADAISFMLQQTPAYKERFAANDQRIKNGLAPLSAAEYLATERSYRQVLQSSGLPATFYDQHSDMKNLIAADISPDELQKRANYAFQYVNSSIDPAVKQTWLDYYGVDTGHLAAHFLDPSAAEASLARQATSVDIGTAAARNGLQAAKASSESYADQGLTYADALKGYGEVATALPQDANIAAHLGASYTQADAESEFLGGLASAARKRQSLQQGEQALFASGQGNDSRSLNVASTGSF